MCPGQGQGETKHRPALRAVLRPDLTPVGLDDRARDRQPEPGALLLGGIKRLENIAQLIAWNTGAGIRNRDLAAASARRFKCSISSSRRRSSAWVSRCSWMSMEEPIYPRNVPSRA